jgi:hypothetical protein
MPIIQNRPGSRDRARHVGAATIEYHLSMSPQPFSR